MSTFNLFNSSQKINEAISGANLLLNDVWGYTGNANLNGSFYGRNIHASGLAVSARTELSGDFSAYGNTFLSQVTGGLRVTGESAHNGNFRVTGALYVNGVAITGEQNITNNITGSELASYSTGDFTVSGHLIARSGILITGNKSQLISVSGNNNSAYGTDFVSITGKSSSNVAVKVHNGSLQVTGVFSTAYLQGGHRSHDGAIGTTGVLDLTGVSTMTFKDGLLISYELLFPPLPYTYNLGYSAVDQAGACTNAASPTAYYSDAPFPEGGLFTDDIGQVPAPDGYYSDGTNAYSYTHPVLTYSYVC